MQEFIYICDSSLKIKLTFVDKDIFKWFALLPWLPIIILVETTSCRAAEPLSGVAHTVNSKAKALSLHSIFILSISKMMLMIHSINIQAG